MNSSLFSVIADYVKNKILKLEENIIEFSKEMKLIIGENGIFFE